MKSKTIRILRPGFFLEGLVFSRPDGEAGSLFYGVMKSSGVLSLLLLALLLSGCSGGGEDIDPKALRGGEMRQTLSPAYFTGRSAKGLRGGA